MFESGTLLIRIQRKNNTETFDFITKCFIKEEAKH